MRNGIRPKKNTVCKVKKHVLSFAGDASDHKLSDDPNKESAHDRAHLPRGPPSLDRLLSTEETANVFGVTPNTLEKWRVFGRGPKFIRVGRRIRYSPTDIAAYLAESTRTSTSTAPAT
jgi:hypothetical protein